MIIDINGDVKVLFNYKCSRCDEVKRGSSYKTIKIKGSPVDIKLLLGKYISEPNYMPIGWANFYDGYRCNKCK